MNKRIKLFEDAFEYMTTTTTSVPELSEEVLGEAKRMLIVEKQPLTILEHSLYGFNDLLKKGRIFTINICEGR